ncbi:hypothetical protein LI82_10110 [Methanococcoides methylutens]|uniref:Glycosyl transferase n=1 Tax=Methanococcoides methylutens TaxID=2226 RepID=A0A099T1S3_METMT|nr:glycosyltransferase family 4 protein [Methanococcoides methylutens]KGK98083.1 hypothetical protein LI82_10110 [Methanococcoides methylutens]
MNIIIIVPNFVPEIGSTSHIYFDLAKAFVQKGHEVDVITSYPRKYNLDKINSNSTFLVEETLQGVRIHRCKHTTIRDNIVIRGLEHFLLPIYYFNTYRKLKKKFDVCIVSIPPLPLHYLAKKIKNYDGTPTILNFQDFHPQELTDVGVLKNPLIIKMMEHIEKKSYRNADIITVLSQGGINYVTKRGGDINKIYHIYNGVSLSDFDNYATKNDFKEKEGIKNKFLITYAGILSPFQKIESILDVAKILDSHEDIIFYIVGDGMVKDNIERRIKDEMISNVRLLPLQPREEYLNIINSSDLSLILLDERMKAPCIPGKTISLMASKQPIIAIVAKDSETAYVVNKAQCGCIVEPDNIEKFKNTILELKNSENKRKNYGCNGRRFLEENMNLNNIIDDYEKVFSILHEEGEN